MVNMNSITEYILLGFGLAGVGIWLYAYLRHNSRGTPTQQTALDK